MPLQQHSGVKEKRGKESWHGAVVQAEQTEDTSRGNK